MWDNNKYKKYLTSLQLSLFKRKMFKKLYNIFFQFVNFPSLSANELN